MPDDPETPAPEPTPEPDATPPPAPDLGEAGRKAIDAERNARKAAEKQLKTMQAELEQLRTATQSEQERAIAAAKAEGRAEVLAESNRRLIAAEVKAAAASRLHDPADALRLLDLDQFEVGADGAVNVDSITAAIAELVEAKPYLAAGAKPAPAPTGSAEGGAREPNSPKSLTEQIVEAEKAGDLRTAMALRTQLLVAAPVPNGG